MRCDRHGLATGPDGKCARCHTIERRFEQAGFRSRDPVRRVALLVIGLVALVASYAILTSIADTRRAPGDQGVVDAPR